MNWDFLLFPAIGAAIGALTNQIAIKMLFRPHRAIHLGSWRLPFTPGLIPSQRGIIARNMAETFESQLLSGEQIHSALTGARAREMAEAKVGEMLASLGPMGAMAEAFRPTIVAKVLAGVEEMATEFVAEGGELDVGRRVEDRINAMDIAHLEELVLGFSRRQFRHITFFGGVLGALIGVVQALLNLTLHGS